jgi:hypothetical protein
VRLPHVHERHGLAPRLLFVELLDGDGGNAEHVRRITNAGLQRGMVFALPSAGGMVVNEQIENLLYEALETELGGVEVYTNAVACAVNSDLKKEWTKYLDQTKRHVKIVQEVLERLGMDIDKETPGREIVRNTGEGLVRSIEMAREGGDPDAAQIVAAECVVLAETKDHQNWSLIGEAAGHLEGKEKDVLSQAHEEVEEEEDEHLYHTQGWARELWVQALGFPAVLPPPEEKADVKSAIGAAMAKKSRALLPKKESRKSPAPRTHAAVAAKGGRKNNGRSARRSH